MGFIRNLVRGQFINVIEWTDDSRDVMVKRYDEEGHEIMMGAQLTVRESQVAVFVNEGELADVFTPGRYELSTQNMPIMTKLKSWKFGFNSPFKAEVYFVNTRQFIDQKWGTSNPVMMRDNDFGMIRLRAFGIYSFRVEDAARFLREVFGTSALLTTAGVDGQLKRTVTSCLSEAIAESRIPALDLAANYDELSRATLDVASAKIEPMGLKLTNLVIENISLPEEVEKAMDKRTSMGVLGNMAQYTQFQAAESMRDAARNPGGAAGMGMGFGAGAAMGHMMNSAMAGTMNPQQAEPAGAFCTACGARCAAEAKFCPSCGAARNAGSACAGCGAKLTPGAKFCPECGRKQ